MLCIFHMICSCLNFVTIFKQFEFQKFFAQLDDFVIRINFSMIFCSILITSYTLSFTNCYVCQRSKTSRDKLNDLL